MLRRSSRTAAKSADISLTSAAGSTGATAEPAAVVSSRKRLGAEAPQEEEKRARCEDARAAATEGTRSASAPPKETPQ